MLLQLNNFLKEHFLFNLGEDNIDLLLETLIANSVSFYFERMVFLVLFYSAHFSLDLLG